MGRIGDVVGTIFCLTPPGWLLCSQGCSPIVDNNKAPATDSGVKDGATEKRQDGPIADLPPDAPLKDWKPFHDLKIDIITPPDQSKADSKADGSVYDWTVADRGPDKMSLDKKIVADKKPDQKIIPDKKIIPDQKIADQMLPDKKVPDKLVADKMVPDQMKPDKTIPDKMLPDVKACTSFFETDSWTKSYKEKIYYNLTGIDLGGVDFLIATSPSVPGNYLIGLDLKTNKNNSGGGATITTTTKVPVNSSLEIRTCTSSTSVPCTPTNLLSGNSIQGSADRFLFILFTLKGNLELKDLTVNWCAW